MFSPADWTLELEYDSQRILHPLGKMIRTDAFFVDASWNPIEGNTGVQFQLSLHPKQAFSLKKLRLLCSYPYADQQRIFCNGYQSWSDSGEYLATAGIPALRRIARPFFKYYGDDWIPGIPRSKGLLHSWTYSYIRQQGQQVLFIASLNESSCFTRIIHDTINRQLILELDIDQLQLTHSYPALEILLFSGNLPDAMNRWRNMMDFPARPRQHNWAWNSGDRFYQNTDLQTIIAEAHDCREFLPEIKWFQMEDGYQKETGDWLKMKPEFQKKLGTLAQEIRKTGMEPGLWLAPFVCSRKSDIFKQHPDWILRDKKGKQIKAGYNSLWGGWYYALNIYHPGVREYLTGIFHVFTRQMGYKFLKLDFLFAAAISPPSGKTRGQVMQEGMEFLRLLAGPNVKLLASGVPLASAFGQVDFCRIGPAVHLKWEHTLLAWLRKRERASTQNAVKTILGRWMLNGQFFDNDPDVFLLRHEGNQLQETQRSLLLLLNILLGNIHFTSDNPGSYTPETRQLLRDLKPLENAKVTDIQNLGAEKYLIRYMLEEDQNYKLEIDLKNAGYSILALH
ncbi:MAG: alpha-galactosidase [Saprospiraceae bacterium]|nr:alpha-galactosidase [Saprospiraceae bacterium]